LEKPGSLIHHAAAGAGGRRAGPGHQAAGDLNSLAAVACSAKSSTGLFLPRKWIGPRARAATPGGMASWLRRLSGGVNNPVEMARGEMVDRVLSWKQPPPGPFDPPPVTQQLEQLWGEHCEAVLAALCVREIYVAMAVR
jgi:hypothetical protein